MRIHIKQMGINWIICCLKCFSFFCSYDKEAKYDYFLRKFEFSKALKAALMPFIVNKHPERTVAVLRELQKRRALEKAFNEKDPIMVKRMVRFCMR